VWIPNQKNNNNQQDLSRGNRLPSGGALWSDSSDIPLGLVCGCDLDNSSSRLNVAHTAYHTFLRRWCGCGTTNWYCLTSNSATQPRARRPSPPFKTHVCSFLCDNSSGDDLAKSQRK
jgi:hypothetical protein